MITQQLNNKTVFKNKNIDYQGIRARVRALYKQDGSEMFNGIVRNQYTKF